MNSAEIETYKSLLDYNKEDGVLMWKPRSAKMFPSARAASVWNSRFSGKQAGWKASNGYVAVSIAGKKEYVHRVIWAMFYGYAPKEDIDHINGNRCDNRLENLREASRSKNLQNVKVARVSNKSSGILGVSRNHNGWRARITLDGVEKSLGTYAIAQDASEAYITAKRELHAGNTL